MRGPIVAPRDELGSADLITVALDLLEAADRKENSAHLRRSLSTAYYAMFHCLARMTADRLIRARGTPREKAAWLHVYCALQHQHARKQCLDSRAMATHPTAVRYFAAQFAALQDHRHQADYNPATEFEPAEVRKTVESAAEAVRLLEGASQADQAVFATWVLLLARRS